MAELTISTEDVETLMVAVDSYKRARIGEALNYNREGIASLSDKAWRDAATLDVYWHRLQELLPD